MLSMMHLTRRREVERYQPKFNDALLCRARATVAMHFLEQTQAEVLLMVDGDVVFDTDAAIRVCEAALTYDIVGGQYVTRTRGKMCFPTSVAFDGDRIYYGNDATPHPVKWVSGGFVATHRRVFERLARRVDCPVLHASEAWRFRPFYTPFWMDRGDGELIYLSEDWAMVERAKQEGFTAYIDPSVRLQHMGQHPFRLEDLLQEMLPTQPIYLTREPNGSYEIEVPAAVPA